MRSLRRIEIFGDCSRFALNHFTGRDGSTWWMVADAEIMDPVTGLPETVVQVRTEDASAEEAKIIALAGV